MYSGKCIRPNKLIKSDNFSFHLAGTPSIARTAQGDQTWIRYNDVHLRKKTISATNLSMQLFIEFLSGQIVCQL